MDLSPGLLNSSSAPAALLSTLILLSAAACGPPADTARSTLEAAGTTGVVFPPTSRPDVRGVSGAVSAGHPLAAAAGHEVLRRGGNAMDAAIAMAGVLAVVRPHMNGVGGDAFALYHEAATGQVHAMNGSGRAGALATPELFAERGLERMPGNGPLSVSVPGGEPPPVGSLLRNPALAVTLESIARHGREGFYRGAVADRLAAFIEAEGGYVRAPDLAAHTTTWVEPLRGGFAGYTMLVLPPNTQGIAQLQLFEMARAFDLKAMQSGSTAYLHTLIEMMKLAFADRDQWAADPEFTDIPLGDLLDPAYLARRAGMVDPNAAAESRDPGVGARVATTVVGETHDDSGDTVYLTAVDRWGNAVSWIQSLFAGFGSGLLEPETGVVLHNRGALFNLEPGSSEHRRARQAALSHPHPHDGAERRRELRLHPGHTRRGQPAAEPATDREQPGALRHDAPGGY